MKTIVFAISLLLFLSSDSQNRGLSYIGMCHRKVSSSDVSSIYEGQAVLNLHFLIRTFNRNGCPTFVDLAKDARPMIVHISLLNGPGLRNRRLQKHEYLYGYTIRTAQAAILKRQPKILQQVRAAAEEARQLLEARGPRLTILRIKPILESDFNKKARRIVYREVQKVFKGIPLIDNPVKDSCVPELLCETHGTNTEGDIIDLDGLDYHDTNGTEWQQKGEQKVGMFVWKFCNNGFKPGEKWIPPLTRKHWCKGEDLSFFRNWLKA